LRQELCDRLKIFGIKLDPVGNVLRSKDPRTISSDDSAVRVMVVPTNEELAIARQTFSLLE